jgi:hypothetical protein
MRLNAARNIVQDRVNVMNEELRAHIREHTKKQETKRNVPHLSPVLNPYINIPTKIAVMKLASVPPTIAFRLSFATSGRLDGSREPSPTINCPIEDRLAKLQRATDRIATVLGDN